ncbi:NAD(P)/FAD-dependent oxidoreductase [Nocardioides sp.]|uniref:NAD(P)/FAD-dependent oxidoreductase n=1 Tax=Nocardioides sp. TaxID=35761 RepID=UPI003D116C9A
MDDRMDFDVIVIGGGAAGLSAATTLARARRAVVVLDAGEPRNAPAAGVHGFLGHDGVPPLELLARGRAELAGYGGEFRSTRVTGTERLAGGFAVVLADSGRVTALRLVVTTGLVDVLPDVPGLRERWGRDVLHCPYCHGWEVQDLEIAVLATGPMALHQALLFTQWSSDIVLLLNDQPDPDPDWLRRFEARGGRTVRPRVDAVETRDDALSGVRLVDGSVVPCQAMVVGAPVRARSEFLAGLGLTTADFLMGEHVVGTHVAADALGQTAVPGVYVAGNVTDPTSQVVAAAAAGMKVGAWINAELIQAEAG